MMFIGPKCSICFTGLLSCYFECFSMEEPVWYCYIPVSLFYFLHFGVKEAPMQFWGAQKTLLVIGMPDSSILVSEATVLLRLCDAGGHHSHLSRLVLTGLQIIYSLTWGVITWCQGLIQGAVHVQCTALIPVKLLLFYVLGIADIFCFDFQTN